MATKNPKDSEVERALATMTDPAAREVLENLLKEKNSGNPLTDSEMSSSNQETNSDEPQASSSSSQSKKRPANPMAGTCQHEISEMAIFNVLGNPNKLVGNPPYGEGCNSLLRKVFYEDEGLTWSFYTNRVKVDLVKGLFDAFEKCGKEEFPGEDDIKSLRKTLHKHFPKILGYGQLWSKGAKSGYEMHKRCKDPKPHQDCVFWTMISRLNIEKDGADETITNSHAVFRSVKNCLKIVKYGGITA